MSVKRVWIASALGIACAILAVVVAAVWGPARHQQKAHKGDMRPNILLLTVDTLRADHTSLHHYERDTTPNLATFFKQGVIYDRAYSATSRTESSVISFLTGQYAQTHGIRLQLQKIPPDLVTIATLLRAQGYETAAVVSNSILARESIGLDTHFDFYDDYVDEKEAYRNNYERGSRGTTNAALRWLVSHQKTDKPVFLWVHYMDPHGPYHPPENKPKHFTHEVPVYIWYDHIPEYVREPNNNDGMDYIDRYDEEIAYFDQGAGKLLAAWDDLGFGERSLVIFTADHGEAMMDHELWFEHMYSAFEEAVHVPLAVRGKGFPEGMRVDERVSNIDVAPTILAAAGLPLPDDLDGVRLSTDPAPRHIFVESSFEDLQWRGVLEAKTPRKYMALINTKGEEDARVRQAVWYDLSRDPHEQVPLPWPGEDARTSGAMALVEWIKADRDVGLKLPRRYVERGREVPHPKVPPGIAPDVDAAALERLRALGYVK